MMGVLSTQIIFFASGVCIGSLVTLGILELTWKRLKKRASADQRLRLNTDIINDTLKFFFKTNDILNDLWIDKKIWSKMHSEDTEKSFEFEQKMLRRFEDHTKKDFFNELMYHSYRLKQLDDKSVFGEFESLMHAFKDLAGQVLVAKTAQEYAHLDTKYQDLKKSFLEKCAKVAVPN